jgi:hypothetical protein
VAIILENFDELVRADKAVLPRDKLNEFVDAWTDLDPDAHGKISTVHMEDLIRALPPPLGVKDPAITVTRVSLLRVIKDLDIPIDGGTISYQDTFRACLLRVLSDTDDYEDEVDITHEREIGREGEEVEAVAGSENIFSGLYKRFSSWMILVSALVPYTVGTPLNPALKNPQRCAGVGKYFDAAASITDRPATTAEDYAARSVQLAYREFREKKLQVYKGMRRTTLIELDIDLVPGISRQASLRVKRSKIEPITKAV